MKRIFDFVATINFIQIIITGRASSLEESPNLTSMFLEIQLSDLNDTFSPNVSNTIYSNLIYNI